MKKSMGMGMGMGKEKSSDEKFKLVDVFYKASPFTKNVLTNHELEVKFATKGYKHFSKIDYDNVIRKLKSLEFYSPNEQGIYMFRIQNEYLDPKSGQFRMSNIRTEINGFHAIQDYCKTNDINQVKNASDYINSVQFVKKSPVVVNGELLRDENFNDFNFRLSYKTEDLIGSTSPIVRNLTETWQKVKKTFRYINRVSFIHPDLPVSIDMSIVKSSKREGREYKKTYTTDEAGVFSNAESFEIEIEIDNQRIGPSTKFNNAASIVNALRKTIKYILMGLQGTNYPISFIEQSDSLRNYMKLLHEDKGKYDPEKRIYPSDFIGPSSYTLQMQNIMPLDENTNVPNIRKDFVVTDKADGDRHLLYISNKGKLYLINTNMDVMFTGVQTKEITTFNSLLDGELIFHDKGGKFINLYAVFDIYYVNKEDIRHHPFLPFSEKEMEKAKEAGKKYPKSSRYALLKKMLDVLNPVSIVEGELCPLRIESKRFYPESIGGGLEEKTAIFRACKTILSRVENGAFEYNTDGLIFTPAFLGVGADEIGKSGKLTKSTWEYSFKWKPAEYNTIDFLVTTKKLPNGEDTVTPVFEDGINVYRTSGDLTKYKTLVLRCGFDERKHGFTNPCQDVIEDKLPEFGNIDNEDSYKPVQFYPTQPYDAKAGLCNVMLRKDDTGIEQLFTEEGEVFQDNTIVEFKYDLNIEESEWRWKPLRMRYDKTAELRQGLKNFGNAYHVANSNWKSIHNPITVGMISTGLNVPDVLEDSDVYYNRLSSSTKTRSLRDFHNLFVKRLLIKSVAKRGDILIDYACGKAGDFPKWINAQLSFVFGIDISKDNLENKLDGACARFLNNRKKFKHVPYVLFVNGNSGLNIRSGQAMFNDKAVQITKAVFGEGVGAGDKKMDMESLGKGVARQYGKGQEGFQISSCQFALHYFFENMVTFQNFLINLAECTKLGGYFVGASYDGKTVFQMLKNKEKGEGVGITTEDGTKVWEIKKEYDEMDFPDNSTSIGYKIDVYQESINKLIPEYLVNYDYFNRVMENYGFQLVAREESASLGIPEASGLFSELYQNMMNEIKTKKYKASEYGEAANMTAYEKKISFLNRYFVYKKVRNVNASKVIIEEEGEDEGNGKKMEKKKGTKKKKEKEEEDKSPLEKSVQKTRKIVKPKVKKLTAKLVLSQDTITPEEKDEKDEKDEIEKEKYIKKVYKAPDDVTYMFGYKSKNKSKNKSKSKSKLSKLKSKLKK